MVCHMAIFTEYLRVFLVGGLFCVVGQILIDRTNFTPGRILVSFVTAGVVLSALGLYQPLVDFAGAGATVPLTGFGHALADGVREGPVGSYNGFNPDVNLETQSRRGDYIFYKGDVKLLGYRCIDDKFDGQYPSDHLPVMADMQIEEYSVDE